MADNPVFSNEEDAVVGSVASRFGESFLFALRGIPVKLWHSLWVRSLVLLGGFAALFLG